MGGGHAPQAQAAGAAEGSGGRSLELPAGVYLPCRECGREGLHEVLKGRARRRGGATRLDALVRCGSCGSVRRELVVEGGEREVRAVLSDQGSSVRRSIALDKGLRVSTGDELIVNGLRCVVTSIEASGARKRRAAVPEIQTLWLKRFDRVRVKVSISIGRRTVARDFWALPEEELEIGDVLEVGSARVLVHALSVGGRILRRGAARARDVKRVYGREVDEL
ncbi:MAG: HVO_0476 family zinc finger protein [Thermoplasmatota archaeon]